MTAQFFFPALILMDFCNTINAAMKTTVNILLCTTTKLHVICLELQSLDNMRIISSYFLMTNCFQNTLSIAVFKRVQDETLSLT